MDPDDEALFPPSTLAFTNDRCAEVSDAPSAPICVTGETSNGGNAELRRNTVNTDLERGGEESCRMSSTSSGKRTSRSLSGSERSMLDEDPCPPSLEQEELAEGQKHDAIRISFLSSLLADEADDSSQASSSPPPAPIVVSPTETHSITGAERSKMTTTCGEGEKENAPTTLALSNPCMPTTVTMTPTTACPTTPRRTTPEHTKEKEFQEDYEEDATNESRESYPEPQEQDWRQAVRREEMREAEEPHTEESSIEDGSSGVWAVERDVAVATVVSTLTDKPSLAGGPFIDHSPCTLEIGSSVAPFAPSETFPSGSPEVMPAFEKKEEVEEEEEEEEEEEPRRRATSSSSAVVQLRPTRVMTRRHARETAAVAAAATNEKEEVQTSHHQQEEKASGKEAAAGVGTRRSDVSCGSTGSLPPSPPPPARGKKEALSLTALAPLEEGTRNTRKKISNTTAWLLHTAKDDEDVDPTEAAAKGAGGRRRARQTRTPPSPFSTTAYRKEGQAAATHVGPFQEVKTEVDDDDDVYQNAMCEKEEDGDETAKKKMDAAEEEATRRRMEMAPSSLSRGMSVASLSSSPLSWPPVAREAVLAPWQTQYTSAVVWPGWKGGSLQQIIHQKRRDWEGEYDAAHDPQRRKRSRCDAADITEGMRNTNRRTREGYDDDGEDGTLSFSQPEEAENMGKEEEEAIKRVYQWEVHQLRRLLLAPFPSSLHPPSCAFSPSPSIPGTSSGKDPEASAPQGSSPAEHVGSETNPAPAPLTEDEEREMVAEENRRRSAFCRHALQKLLQLATAEAQGNEKKESKTVPPPITLSLPQNGSSGSTVESASTISRLTWTDPLCTTARETAPPSLPTGMPAHTSALLTSTTKKKNEPKAGEEEKGSALSRITTTVSLPSLSSTDIGGGGGGSHVTPKMPHGPIKGEGAGGRGKTEEKTLLDWVEFFSLSPPPPSTTTSTSLAVRTTGRARTVEREGANTGSEGNVSSCVSPPPLSAVSSLAVSRDPASVPIHAIPWNEDELHTIQEDLSSLLHHLCEDKSYVLGAWRRFYEGRQRWREAVRCPSSLSFVSSPPLTSSPEEEETNREMPEKEEEERDTPVEEAIKKSKKKPTRALLGGPQKGMENRKAKGMIKEEEQEDEEGNSRQEDAATEHEEKSLAPGRHRRTGFSSSSSFTSATHHHTPPSPSGSPSSAFLLAPTDHRPHPVHPASPLLPPPSLFFEWPSWEYDPMTTLFPSPLFPTAADSGTSHGRSTSMRHRKRSSAWRPGESSDEETEDARWLSQQGNYRSGRAGVSDVPPTSISVGPRVAAGPVSSSLPVRPPTLISSAPREEGSAMTMGLPPPLLFTKDEFHMYARYAMSSGKLRHDCPDPFSLLTNRAALFRARLEGREASVEPVTTTRKKRG